MKALLVVFLVAAASQKLVDGLAVMSVDFGTEWMKVAIVSPGVPMEIALNKESKRKTPVCISFRDGERTFGEDAQTVGVRFPQNSYSYLLDLLGKSVDNPSVKLFQQRFPYYNIVPDPDRGTVVFQHDSETTYSVEELVAMFLHKAKQFAENTAGQVINEAVITVPGYFNQAERKAMLQAAQLADIKVLQLINDYMAVGLNYGIFRRKDFNETTQYMMFYDMGASSTTATIISYQLVKTKEKGIVETHPQVSILGVGYDRTLGGLEMQIRLRDYLAKKFNEMKKTTQDVFKNHRAMAKLFKEAGRLKNVLSANVDHFAQIEGLLDEVDFKLRVTREEMENLCSDLFDRVKIPVEQSLKTSGLSLDVINQVVLVGAGTRVPKVQEKLTEVVKMELSKNLNTDEAACMGAVYKAADLSTGFKVKKFITKDGVLFPIQVTFEREGEGGTKPVKRMLFGPMNPYPQKKILTFNKHQNDFTFSVSYAELDHIPPHELEVLGSLNLSSVSLSGVGEAMAKHKSPQTESKGIKTHWLLDDSGLLGLHQVELVLEGAEEQKVEESPLSKLGSTISKLFTGPEEALKENIEKPVAEEPEELNDSDPSVSKKDDTGDGSQKGDEGISGDEKKNSTAKDGEKKKQKLVVIKEPIAANISEAIVPPMQERHLRLSIAKIDALNKIEADKARREGALNTLESFVFDVKVKLEDEEEYKAAATPEEGEAIIKMCSELMEWLEEEGFSADAESCEARLKSLKTLTAPVWLRVREARERPEEVAKLLTTLNHTRSFLTNIKNLTKNDVQDPPMFTQVEIDTLEKMINTTQEWLDKSSLEQQSLALTDPPVLTLKALHEKISSLDREVMYLVNKLKLYRPRPKKEDPPKDNKVNETASTIEKDEKAGDKSSTEETLEVTKKQDSESKEEKEIKDETESEEKISVAGKEEVATEEAIDEPRETETDEGDKHSEL